MTPRIEHIDDRKLVGLRIRTSMDKQATFRLFSTFMPRRREPENRLNANTYSVEIYDADLAFHTFTPATEFEKWAAVEVKAFGILPEDMEALTIPAGTYAVFLYKGLAKDFAKTAQYIYGTWLPQSKYELDSRPHFEIMSPAYRPDDPNAEEEIWVPVREK
ncbi:GyrI-like domain-containing protein [Flavisolibacter tropicus]|uniref:AraC family transcriptional regulator n=1 Tax=Flavisolibacter tropicus TaxID=1492898 RepID=A0A172TWB4_9BACT|nr:GyrI-like domain-containing protein [Flavisolibacter tropicus]ANE51320.1 AraC family transcriptional regulator [Flavisolibacter tropicus]